MKNNKKRDDITLEKKNVSLTKISMNKVKTNKQIKNDELEKIIVVREYL